MKPNEKPEQKEKPLPLSREETWQWLLTHIPLAAEHMKQGKALGMTFEKPRVRKR